MSPLEDGAQRFAWAHRKHSRGASSASSQSSKRSTRTPGWRSTSRRPCELLIALILAAQCTDERVNEVTRSLFARYRAARDYAAESQEKLEAAIRSTGFYRQKAKTVRTCCQQIVDRFGGEVPADLDSLLALTGVGRKTANILRGNAFGIPAIGVDTHVARLAQRLGLSAQTDPDRSRQSWFRLCPRPNRSGSVTCSSTTAGGSVSPASRSAPTARLPPCAPARTRPLLHPPRPLRPARLGPRSRGFQPRRSRPLCEHLLSAKGTTRAGLFCLTYLAGRAIGTPITRGSALGQPAEGGTDREVASDPGGSQWR